MEGNTPNDNGEESFEEEKLKELDLRNKGPGGGQLLSAKGARFDDCGSREETSV
jgi:hypothetical protein